MKYFNSISLIFIFSFTLIIQNFANLSPDATEHNVIFSLVKRTNDDKQHRENNHKIRLATYELKQECKKRYKNAIETNTYYPHRRDTVFFVHFDHDSNDWTLYKPSFIPFDDFAKLAKKTYAQFGIQATCNHDKIVKITKNDIGFDNQYMTIDEFETYKQMSSQAITTTITKLQNEASHNAEEIERLQKIQKMKQFFFWHLQIPTTGLLKDATFDIQDEYKPLAWHFLLWDLAPKKGAGAHVAIIDTGISAFNLAEKEYSNMYKKNINITMPNILQDYGYNLVSENGLDPIRQISINFGHYCDQLKFNNNELMRKLPSMIIDFIKNKESIQIEQYMIKNVKNEYLQESLSSFNEKGNALLKDLLYGKYGIAPSDRDSFFHVVKLDSPYNQEVLLETLPAPKIIGNEDPFSAGHGTFTQGVVNAQLYNNQGIHGLAPEAQVIMIKAFNDNGTTNKTTLNAALQRAITLKNPIVSMSLKITDEIDKVSDAPLKKLIDSIDYVVAASGNDGDSKELHNKEAYPAKFDSVAFDVGAFGYTNGKYNICSFTQMELNIGPKFVAPGFDILSAGLTPNQTSDSMYVFMAGTSIAVPVITGFLALVVAEFQEIFTREQILKVIYKFSMKLNGDDIWQKYIKLGTPDMRSSLFCLHTLQTLRQSLKDDSKYLFNENFDKLVEAIYTINYFIPTCYEAKIGFSCTNNFENFKKALESNNSAIPTLSAYIPTEHSIKSYIEFAAQLILQTIDSKKYPHQKIDGFDENVTALYTKLLVKLQAILTTKKFNLFSTATIPAQTRIKAALTPRLSSPTHKI